MTGCTVICWLLINSVLHPLLHKLLSRTLCWSLPPKQKRASLSSKSPAAPFCQPIQSVSVKKNGFFLSFSANGYAFFSPVGSSVWLTGRQNEEAVALGNSGKPVAPVGRLSLVALRDWCFWAQSWAWLSFLSRLICLQCSCFKRKLRVSMRSGCG